MKTKPAPILTAEQRAKLSFSVKERMIPAAIQYLNTTGLSRLVLTKTVEVDAAKKAEIWVKTIIENELNTYITVETFVHFLNDETLTPDVSVPFIVDELEKYLTLYVRKLLAN